MTTTVALDISNSSHKIILGLTEALETQSVRIIYAWHTGRNRNVTSFVAAYFASNLVLLFWSAFYESCWLAVPSFFAFENVQSTTTSDVG